MNGKAVVAVALLGAWIAAAGAVPATPEAQILDQPEQSRLPVCTGAYGVWVVPGTGDFSLGGRPKRVTFSWSCKVHGRELVVKYQRGHPTHECSATENVWVSAWIDRVKIVSEDEAGEAAWCFGQAQLRSITLLSNDDVRFCRDEWPERQAEADAAKRVCTVERVASIRKRPPDPHFVPPDQRTELAFDLRVSNAAFCLALTEQLRPVVSELEDDHAFEHDEIPGTKGWRRTTLSDVQVRSGTRGVDYSWSLRPRTAAFDADNNGRIDKIELDAIQKYHGYVMGQLRWSGAPDAKMLTAGELPWGEPLDQIRKPGFVLQRHYSYVANAIQPVHLFGRNYLYLRRHSGDAQGGDWTGEDYYASQRWGAEVVSRGIAELHPDGTTTLVCGWGPRLRPEDFL